jgi:hypothetical protein
MSLFAVVCYSQRKRGFICVTVDGTCGEIPHCCKEIRQQDPLLAKLAGLTAESSSIRYGLSVVQ